MSTQTDVVKSRGFETALLTCVKQRQSYLGKTAGARGRAGGGGLERSEGDGEGGCGFFNVSCGAEEKEEEEQQEEVVVVVVGVGIESSEKAFLCSNTSSKSNPV